MAESYYEILKISPLQSHFPQYSVADRRLAEFPPARGKIAGNRSKRIMLIGVNFDFVKGNITDWIREEYC